MLFLSHPAVLMLSSSGCLRAAPANRSASNKSLVRCACSSSMITALAFRPCAVWCSAEIARKKLFLLGRAMFFWLSRHTMLLANNGDDLDIKLHSR